MKKTTQEAEIGKKAEDENSERAKRMIEINFIFGLAIYALIFAVVFFTTLPFGVQTPDELGQKVQKGTNPSSPVKPLLWRKLFATAFISAIIFAVLYFVLTNPENNFVQR